MTRRFLTKLGSVDDPTVLVLHAVSEVSLRETIATTWPELPILSIVLCETEEDA